MPIDPVKLALRTERIRAAMKRPGVRAKLSRAALLRDPSTRKRVIPIEATPEQRRLYRNLRYELGLDVVSALREAMRDD